MPAFGLLRRIAIDTILWYCLPLAFLVVYVGVLGRPISAALPHMLVVALPFALQAILRLILSRLISPAGLRIAVCASILALLLGGMITYYVLVVISVHFWGSVVTWSAIPTFFRQAPDVVEAIGIPRFVGLAMALLVMAALLQACRHYLRRFDWTSELRRSDWVKGICSLGAFCVLWLQVANATEAPWIAQEEPLSMSLFPMAGARDIEGHRVTAEQAARLDAIEDKARAVYQPAAAGPKPNVIVIVVDALRPANMSLYGYARKTTPYLDSLERAGLTRKFIAHAACSDTACGLLSLSTSRPPRDFSFRPFGLQEALRRNGYGIHIIQSGTYMHPVREYFGQIDTWFDGTEVDAASISDDQIILDRLARMPDWDGKPAMFQFRLLSAHVTRRDDGKGPFQPAESYILPPRTGGIDVAVPTATNFYDNGVRNADRHIERMLQLLRRKGYLDRALVVVTADHGEALGEHGMFAHANSVHEEVLKVPVVFIAEGYEPGGFSQTPGLALQVDIAPTILAELSIPRPATWRGRPLQTPPQPFVGFFEQRDLTGLVDAREPGKIWKYWLDRTWGDEYVFELGTDPRETRNLVRSVPAGLLQDWRTQVLYAKPAGSVTSLSARIN
jgi:hypothetical protein